MRFSRALLVLPLLGLVAAGCGGSSSGKPTAKGPCASAQASSKAQSFGSEPPLTVTPGTYVATIKTNCGTIVANLDAAKAPHTVNSFAFLAGKHYFDGSPCHRLVTSGIFVLQCGDPTGTGTGGPGYTIPDENLSGATYPAGTLAMANTGQPHTGGSQFFFCYAATPLPPQYTPFGTVTSGLDVLQAIAKNGEDDANGPGDGHPKHAVVIESFTVTKS
ncbi:MAG: peptidylprolyl isomerase [Frankiaceae bacterium]|nr:peptidylprolyl isomerase [Frankiaceae bacterium]MBV9368347.1 peptidylprolyl isomerase [Frankiales bacterium]